MRSYFAFALVLTFTSCEICFAGYQWKNTTSSEAVLLRPIPDGLELIDKTKVNLWLCRIFGDTGRWISGKLFLRNDTSRCIVGAPGGEHWSSEFQTLVASPGTTSWVPNTGKVPENAIESGTTREGNTSYVCRATYNGSVLLGGVREEGMVCWMSKDGKEVHSDSNLEILILNVYGLALEYTEN